MNILTILDYAITNILAAVVINNILAIATLFLVIATAFLAYFAYLQLETQKKVDKLRIFRIVMEEMEYIRNDRQILRKYIEPIKKTKGHLEEQDAIEAPKDVRDAADRICREFDILGLLDHNGCIDSSLVDKLYSVPFVPLYNDFLHYYVKWLQRQENRGPTHFWELVQFYERVKYVPDNHPAKINATDWPSNPRAKPKNLQKIS